MKHLSILATVIVLAALVGMASWLMSRPQVAVRQPLSPSTNTITAVFRCAGDSTIRATFYPGIDTYVDLALSDGRKLSVPRAISASGARYANADESFVFWNKGNTAFIRENGAATFADCVAREAD